MPTEAQLHGRVTRDQWTVVVKWPKRAWMLYRDHDNVSDATEETVAMRSQKPDALWRVEKRRVK